MHLISFVSIFALSSENALFSVLIDNDGTAVIADCGLSKPMERTGGNVTCAHYESMVGVVGTIGKACRPAVNLQLAD